MELHYNAFISYRHAPLDIRIATEIQRRLERYPVPREIQKQTGKKRIERIFRDKEELPITSDLNDDIGEALRHSDFLIVICSTNTASSAWVRREIETFLMTHDRRQVLTVLADGEPQDVIPDLLRSEEIQLPGPDGTLIPQRREIEPLSCDYRLRRSRARREELPRLAAALLGCAYDDLRQRQRRRRVRRLVAGFTAALVLVSGIAAYALDRAWVIARQAEEIEAQYRNTLITQSRYLAEKSGELLAQGDRMGALQVALAGLPAGSADDSRPLVTEALFALNNAVYPYHIAQSDEFLAKCTLETESRARAWDDSDDLQCLSPAGARWPTADGSGQLTVFDLDTDAPLAVLSPQAVLPDAPEAVFLSAAFCSEDRLVLTLSAGVVCWDLSAAQPCWTLPAQTPWAGAVTQADPEAGRITAACWDGETCCIAQLDAATGRERWARTAPLPAAGLFGRSACLAVSPSGEQAAVGFGDNAFGSPEAAPAPTLLVAAADVDTVRALTPEKTDVAALTYLDEDRLCVLTADLGMADALDPAFPFAVAVYGPDSDTPLWSTPGEVLAHRPVGDEALPARSLQRWTRDLDAGPEDLVLVQLAGQLLLLSPEDGEVLRTADFPDDVFSVAPYDVGTLFVALRSGQLMLYQPVGEITGPMGSVSGALRSAAWVPQRGEFLLPLADSQQIVVMSDRLEDESLATVELHSIAQADYAAGPDWEIRVLREATDEDGLQQRLLFYRPRAAEPFAATTADGQILGWQVLPDETGPERCCFLCKQADTVSLCLWDLPQDRLQASWDLGVSSAELVGLWQEQAVVRSGTQLLAIDLQTGDERTLALDALPAATAFSPAGDTLALLSGLGLRLLDLDAWTWRDLSEDLAALHSDPYPSTPCLAFSPDGGRLAVWAGGEACILDLSAGTIAQRLPIPCRSGGKGLFLTDRILLVYGDSGRLTTWDLDTQAVVMEDAAVLDAAPDLQQGDGRFRARSATDSFLYTFEPTGRFARYLGARHACLSPSGSEVLSLRNAYGAGNAISLIEDTGFSVYPLYSLDELVAKATALLDGRTLSPADKLRYFIEG